METAERVMAISLLGPLQDVFLLLALPCLALPCLEPSPCDHTSDLVVEKC